MHFTPATYSREMKTIKIGLLIYPGCMPAGLFAAADLFQAINRRTGQRMLETLWLSADGGSVAMPHGLVLEPAHSLHERCDAYLLPGFWAESAADLDCMLDRHTPMLEWLRQLPEQTALWSYCMGVALLAESGRIDKRQATATWWLERPLRQRFAAVDWDFHQPVIADGNVLTAAGANGYWALLSKLLTTWLPPEVLRDVELAMLLPRSNVTHPAFRPVELLAQSDGRLQRLIAYAQKLPATSLNLDSAAQYLAVSSRTLSRIIGQGTGVGAGEWLRLVKLRQVGNALLSSDAPVKLICEELGFADEASLMRSFKRATGMTTSQYRQQFGHAVNSFSPGNQCVMSPRLRSV
jgi:transcriptional regulator GlxA family with amidase domain